MKKFLIPILLLLCTAGSVATAAEPGADHPLVGRFQGAEMTAYGKVSFGEYPLIVSKITQYGGIEENADATRMLEGRVIHITYRSDKKFSTLAVFRAYGDALTANGFETLFECSDEACGGRNFNHASPGYHGGYMQFAENDEDQRYLAAHLARPEGDLFVAVHTARNTSNFGDYHDFIYTQVDVVEIEPQTTQVVVLKADEMAARIDADGKTALYGIYFDTNEASIKPESKPALDEVGKLLKNHPELNLLVVGHTDNQGNFDYNIDLSQRRAAAVVKALVDDYGIAPDRLKPWGDGYTAPAASNATADGRASNRRVELVRGKAN